MKVVVTGGAGYIGSVTSDLLLQEGHDVVVIDDLRTGHRDLVPDGATFLNADVADPRTYGAALQGTHACLHFAASAEAGISMQRPEAFYANNTAATLRLLNALIGAEWTVSCCRRRALSTASRTRCRFARTTASSPRMSTGTRSCS